MISALESKLKGAKNRKLSGTTLLGKNQDGFYPPFSLKIKACKPFETQ